MVRKSKKTLSSDHVDTSKLQEILNNEPRIDFDIDTQEFKSIVHNVSEPEQARVKDIPRRRNKSRKYLYFLSFFLISALLFCIFTLYKPFFMCTNQLNRIITEKYHTLRLPPLTVKEGSDLSHVDLISHLKKLGYSRAQSREVGKKEFFLEGNRLFIHRPNNEGPLSVTINNKRITKLQDGVTGEKITHYLFNREILNYFLHSLWEQRIPLSYDDFPPHLLKAVQSAEDKNFFSHPGIDYRGIARAALINFQQGRIAQGGSTITQQLVKILLARQERTWGKKIEELFLALALDALYTKEEIFSAYLNNVYLGQMGRFEIRGMAAAANYIIGKDLKVCTTSEVALLAGLIRSPNSASPIRHPLSAAARTKTVLQQMDISGRVAIAKTIVSPFHRKTSSRENLASLYYYYSRLEKELKKLELTPKVTSVPYTIDLALNLSLQQRITASLDEHLRLLEKRNHRIRGKLQGAVVALNPKTGEIYAFTGGRDFRRSQFDRAFSAKRQIGSLIKPFTYVTALGGETFHPALTQASILIDSPIKVRFDNISWKPKNYDKKYLGPITVREALAKSRNIPAIRVGLDNNLEKVADLIQSLAINPAPDRRPSLLLGASESSPVAMAAAYGTLANGGKIITPGLIHRVLNNKTIIWKHQQPQPFLSPESCYIITDILRSVFTGGSALRAASYAKGKNIAGKTGTTNRMCDSWFAGYSPDLVMVVWIGRDDNKSIGLTGAAGALPLWMKNMQEHLSNQPQPDFFIPAGITFEKRAMATGKPVKDGQTGVNMAFIKGTESPNLREKIVSRFN